MRKPEQRLWDRLKRIFDRVPQGFTATRIENKASTGMPDLYLRSVPHKMTGWVELKVAKMRGPEKTHVCCDHLTGPQKSWLSSQWKCERNGFLLVEIQDKDGNPHSAYLLSGREAWKGIHCDPIESLKSRAIYWETDAVSLVRRINWYDLIRRCRQGH